jgi:DNA-binding Lrp family transcriptional regulator
MDKVLKILRSEGRASAEDIAKRLGHTTEEVSAKIKKLEDDQVILGYQALINPDKAHDERVLAIIEVRLIPMRDTGFDAIAQRIYKFPEVRTCYLMSGSYDLHVIVEGMSLREVARFVSEKLATIEGVSGTATHFILKKYKEFGVSMQETERVERLAVAP